MSAEQDRKLLCNTLVHQYGGQDEEKVCVFRMSFFLVTKNKSDASDHLMGITGTLYQCWTLSLFRGSHGVRMTVVSLQAT